LRISLSLSLSLSLCLSIYAQDASSRYAIVLAGPETSQTTGLAAHDGRPDGISDKVEVKLMLVAECEAPAGVEELFMGYSYRE
jgi:hypothetical protein